MTEQLKINPQTLDEAKELISDMFMSSEIGTYGQAHWNGADSYHCPCCGASKDIMGHQWGPSGHHEVEHKPNCRQDALYRW